MAAERELGMSQIHRKHINDYIENLIKCTTYDSLAYECVNSGLITQVMRENLEKRNTESHNISEEEEKINRHRRLFIKITKRGPRAYTQLRQICYAHFPLASTILENVGSVPQGSTILDNRPFLSLNSLNSHCSAHSSVNSYTNSTNSFSSDDSLKSPDHVDTHSTFNSGAVKSTYVTTTEHLDPKKSLEPYSGPIPNPMNRTVTKSKCIHTDPINETYRMESEAHRGVLFIANIIDFRNPKKRRNGGEADSDSLIHIFHEFGFKIFSYKNLNQDAFFTVLRKLIRSNYVKETECFVMVLMTHGERTGEIDRVEFSDSTYCNVDYITNLFQSENCPYLIAKPKVLIYPFCRGSEVDKGFNRDRIEKDGVATQQPARFVSTLSDVLICYATTKGFETHRDIDKGSWYIQELCNWLAEVAHNTSLEDILKLTSASVLKLGIREGSLQTGSFKNIGFTKKLFFNPGFPNKETDCQNDTNDCDD